MVKGGARSNSTKAPRIAGARSSTGSQTTAGNHQKDGSYYSGGVESGARAPDQVVPYCDSHLPPKTRMVMKFSTSVNITNSLVGITYMFEEKMKLLFGCTYSELWFPRKVAYFVMVFLCVKSVVDCFSRRYGVLLPILCGFFLSVSLCLHYNAVYHED